jgi:hypothetical protein
MNEGYDPPNKKGEGSWSRGSANAAARCIKRAAMGAHGGHSSPVHRLLLPSCSSSPSLGINAAESNRNRPDRTGRLSPRLGFLRKRPQPTAPAPFLFSPELEPTPSPIQTVAAVAERVVNPDSPSGGLRLRPTRSPVLSPPQSAFAPIPSRPLSLAEARELSSLGRVVVHPAAAAAVTKRGISARDATIPAVMCGSEGVWV